jgi:glutathione S-transferase
MLKLYYVPDTCSLATHIALIDASAQYELVRMSFTKEDQKRPDYLKINPKARVPALITDDGVLTETPALLAYVAQAFPHAGLAPGGAFEFSKIQEFNSYLCSTAHVAHAHRMRGYRWADEPEAYAAMQRKVPTSVTQCYELVEREMLKGPWVMGDQYTICDPYLFTLAQWLEADGVDMNRIPKVRDHRTRMRERPSTDRALREELAA